MRLAVVAATASARWVDRAARGSMTPSSASRYDRVFSSFVRFSRASGAHALEDLDTRLVCRFVRAPLPGRVHPSRSTSRFRLTVIRDAFDGFVDSGLAGENPAAGLRVDRAVSLVAPQPLIPDEVRRLRTVARLRPADTLRPATVELALLGLTHAEISKAVVSDLDLSSLGLMVGNGALRRLNALPINSGRVLSSSVDTRRRAARRQRRAWNPDQEPLALTRPLSTYPLESIAPTVSTNLTRALTAAGISRPGVRPRSLREYAANAAYARSGRIEDVATLLGIRSLDSARRLIDFEWQQRWGETAHDSP